MIASPVLMDAINVNINREMELTSYTVLNVNPYKSQITESAA